MAATIMTSVNSMKFCLVRNSGIWWVILRGDKFSKQSGGFKSIQLNGRVGENWSEQLVLFFIIIFYQKEPFAHRGPALKKFGPKNLFKIIISPLVMLEIWFLETGLTLLPYRKYLCSWRNFVSVSIAMKSGHYLTTSGSKTSRGAT